MTNRTVRRADQRGHPRGDQRAEHPAAPPVACPEIPRHAGRWPLRGPALAGALALLLGGCANLAPPYQAPTPAVPAQWPVAITGAASAGARNGAVPGTHPGTTPGTSPGSAAGNPAHATAGMAPDTAADLRDEPVLDAAALPGWRALILLPPLRETIALALGNSRTLRLAVIAIEQARATARIDEAALLPTLRGSAGASAAHTPAVASSSGQAVNSRSLSAGVGVSAFELDVFGRLRNTRDAALLQVLASEQTRASTQIALVAEVANAWLTLQADQQQLALARATLASEQATLALTEQRRTLGADTGLAVAQAQTGVAGARRDVAVWLAQVQQDRQALDLLVGTPVPERLLPPAPAAADAPAEAGPSAALAAAGSGAAASASGSTAAGAAAALVAVPADLPSSVLLQRPDVQAAESALKASYADIGVARAARYPQISLTASTGLASSTLVDLLRGGAWSLAPTLSLPLLDHGASAAQVRAAELARDAALARYDQALQTAFREVADALAVRATLQQRQQAQADLVAASARALALARARWQAGAAGFLDVLDAQRTLYAAWQAQITLQLAEQGNRITLFKVLGGGGQAEPAAARADAATATGTAPSTATATATASSSAAPQAPTAEAGA